MDKIETKHHFKKWCESCERNDSEDMECGWCREDTHKKIFDFRKLYDSVDVENIDGVWSAIQCIYRISNVTQPIFFSCNWRQK